MIEANESFQKSLGIYFLNIWDHLLTFSVILLFNKSVVRSLFPLAVSYMKGLSGPRLCW